MSGASSASANTRSSYALRSAVSEDFTMTAPPPPLPAVAQTDGQTARKRKRFVGVRQRPSGRWVAEIKDTTQKIRMWLGTFETAEDAARAYDEAARLLRGSNTRTNFTFSNSTQTSNSALASRINRLLTLRRDKKTSDAAPAAVPLSASASEPNRLPDQKKNPRSAAPESAPVPQQKRAAPVPEMPTEDIQITDAAASSTDEYGYYFSSDCLWPFDFGASLDCLGDLPVLDSTEFPPLDEVSMMAAARSGATGGSHLLDENSNSKSNSNSAWKSVGHAGSGIWGSANSGRGDGSANPTGGDALWDLPPLCPLSCRT